MELKNIKRDYPKLNYQKTNSYYHGLLQNLYAGAEGEIVSCLQSKYYSFNAEDKELAVLYSRIAQQDFIHIELLAKAIMMCGGDPKLISKEGRYISGKQIDYLKNDKASLLANIELKEKSVIEYKEVISKISAIELKMYLERILSDETCHLEQLKNFLNILKN